jgi:hypothetical protein
MKRSSDDSKGCAALFSEVRQDRRSKQSIGPSHCHYRSTCRHDASTRNYLTSPASVLCCTSLRNLIRIMEPSAYHSYLMFRHPRVTSLRHGSWKFSRLPHKLRLNMHTWQWNLTLNLDSQPPNDAFLWPGIRAGVSLTSCNKFCRLSPHGLRHSALPTSQSQWPIRQGRLDMRNQHNYGPRLLRHCRGASLPGSRVQSPYSLANRSKHGGNSRLGEWLLPYLRRLLLQDVSLFYARSHHENERASGGCVRTDGGHDNVDATSPDLRYPPMQVSTPVGHFAQEYLLRPSELPALFHLCTEY